MGIFFPMYWKIKTCSKPPTRNPASYRIKNFYKWQHITTSWYQLTKTFSRLSPSLGHKISYYLLNYWQLSSNPCKIGISWGQNGQKPNDVIWLVVSLPISCYFKPHSEMLICLKSHQDQSGWHMFPWPLPGTLLMVSDTCFWDLDMTSDRLEGVSSTWVWTKTLYPSSSHQNNVLIHSHIVDEHGWMIFKHLPSGELR